MVADTAFRASSSRLRRARASKAGSVIAWPVYRAFYSPR
jgi:hypothetical protein